MLFGAKENKKFLFCICLVFSFFFLSLFIFRGILLLRAPLNKTGYIEVKVGEAASDFIKKMQLKGSDFKMAAKLYLFITGLEKRLKPCRIKLDAGDSFISVVNKIVHYKEPLVKLIVFEGMDSFEIAEALKKLHIADAQLFLDKVLSFKMEGYLFPDTYFVSQYSKVDSLIRLMKQNFDEKAAIFLKRAHILTPYKTLILASIVQKETYNKDEMPLIAGVFYNRLKKGIPLQADPTVIYAIKLKLGRDVKLVLTRKDLKLNSPYNTYIHLGLPPTPICNPGLEAIKAAVNPAKTNYLYFVSKGDGTHVFARTLKEHLKNIIKYRNNR